MTRRVTKPKPPLSEERAEILNVICERLTDARKGEIYEVPGTPIFTVKLEDGSYRKKTLDPGQELMFSSVYVGASHKPIFVFEPVDSRPYTQVEMNAKDIDNVLPQFASEMFEAFPDIDAVTMTKLVSMLEAQVAGELRSQREQQREKEAESAANTYANHPLYGRF
jgi:hypothetical protein